MKKKALSMVLTLCILVSAFVIMPVTVSAIPSESDFASKIATLQSKFKNGEYWNKYNASDYSHTGTNKGICGGSYCNNCICECGYFAGGYQCYGFANKMAYETMGAYYKNGYTTSYSLGKVYAGDIIRFGTSDTNGHSIFVYKVVGSTIYFADCNYTGPCQVRWGGKIDNFSSSSSMAGQKFLYIAHLNGNTLTGNGSNPTPTVPSNPWIKCDKTNALTDEIITFTFGATNAVDYTIGIDKNGSRIKTVKNVKSGVSYSFSDAGSYTAYVTCIASSGKYIDSSKVSFTVIKNENLGSNFYARISTVVGNSAFADVDNNLALYEKSNNNNQVWRFIRQSDGSYMIYNVMTGNYIDLDGSKTANFTNIKTYKKNDGAAQHWFLVKNENGYSIVTKCMYSKAIDIDNYTTMHDGTNLRLYDSNLTTAQRFNITPLNVINFKTDSDVSYIDDVLGIKVNKVNESRSDSEIVVFNSEFGSKTNTNKYGKEISFDSNGKFVGFRDYNDENALSIPSGGFVLSEHWGENSKKYINQIKDVYNYAYFDYSTNTVMLFKNEQDYKISINSNGGVFYIEDVLNIKAKRVNEDRIDSGIVVFTSGFGSKTNTNKYGKEISFDSNGKFVGFRDYDDVNQLTIPSGGFVISELWSEDSKKYINQIKGVYNYAYVNYETNTVLLFKNEQDYKNSQRLFIANGEKYSKLPDISKDGYVFDGWYTAKVGGTKISNDSIYSTDTLYAHWTKVEPTTEITTTQTSTIPTSTTTSTTTITVPTSTSSTTVTTTKPTTETTTSSNTATTVPKTEVTTSSTTATTPKTEEYLVSKMMQNVVSTNSIDKIEAGKAYMDILSPADGYKLNSVSVAMNGEILNVPFTDDSCVINIPRVSGDISIIAVATKIETSVTQSTTESTVSENQPTTSSTEQTTTESEIFDITYELNDSVSSNTVTKIKAGDSYSTVITAKKGYDIVNVNVLEGVNSTTTWVLGDKYTVKINSVSGNVRISVLTQKESTYVDLNRYSASLYVKGSVAIKATVKNGKGATTYKSSNPKIAKVDSKGKVTALKAGTAKITVTNNGIKKEFTVTVKNPKLNKSSVSLKKGKSFTLKITGKVGSAKFTSSNKKIATVSKNGKIVAKKKGSATITVKTNGITLKCKVKVK